LVLLQNAVVSILLIPHFALFSFKKNLGIVGLMSEAVAMTIGGKQLCGIILRFRTLPNKCKLSLPPHF